jgi:hypothetical protein
VRGAGRVRFGLVGPNRKCHDMFNIILVISRGVYNLLSYLRLTRPAPDCAGYPVAEFGQVRPPADGFRWRGAGPAGRMALHAASVADFPGSFSGVSRSEADALDRIGPTRRRTHEHRGGVDLPERMFSSTTRARELSD